MFKRFLAVCLLAFGLSVVAPAEASESRWPSARPNVMLIYVDDMRADDMAYMDYTRNLFESTGTVFPNGISPHPLCCPARAELMTGQYAHNSGVFHNDGQYGGMAALERNGKTNLTPQWFRAAGYDTAYVGKYLNGYDGGAIAGADYTEAFSNNVYNPYNFTSWNNGSPTVRNKHTTIWTADRTTNLINTRFAGNAKPFFTITAFLAPHRMKQDGQWVPPYARSAPSAPIPIPPENYRTVEPGDDTPPSFSNPSYNEYNMNDKPSVVSRDFIDDEYVRVMHKARVLSLYAIDDQIKNMVDNLKAQGIFNNTIIAFTSDNGYMLGEHRQEGKDRPYLESLRVPIMFTGPGVSVGVNNVPVTTVDIPTTLATLAEVTPTRTPDGMNALTAPQGRTVLIQSGSVDRKFDWRGVYGARYTYVEHWNSEREFYDRQTDPYELESNLNDPEIANYTARLTVLKGCAGAGCY